MQVLIVSKKEIPFTFKYVLELCEARFENNTFLVTKEGFQYVYSMDEVVIVPDNNNHPIYVSPEFTYKVPHVLLEELSNIIIPQAGGVLRRVYEEIYSVAINNHDFYPIEKIGEYWTVKVPGKDIVKFNDPSFGEHYLPMEIIPLYGTYSVNDLSSCIDEHILDIKADYRSYPKDIRVKIGTFEIIEYVY